VRYELLRTTNSILYYKKYQSSKTDLRIIRRFHDNYEKGNEVKVKSITNTYQHGTATL
jgi:hypothetical protein